MSEAPSGRIININDMPFIARPDCDYPHDYYAMADRIASGEWDELSAYRALFRKDLWAIVYFLLRIPVANHPFVVQACRDVMYGPRSDTLDLWAREHFKSTVLTTAENIQDLLVDPEETIGIFSYAKPLAIAFLRSIKHLFEQSDILKACYPDIIWDNPQAQAPKWSETEGLFIKRKGTPKEASVEAHGLIDGMPTGKHFGKRVYDDVETLDMADSPEMTQKSKDMFDMSENLGREGGRVRVMGTTYSHQGLMVYLRDKKLPDGANVFQTRIKTATTDGTENGPSAYLSEPRLAKLRTNLRMFRSQQLLNPTPEGSEKVDWGLAKEVHPGNIPKRLYKFMLIDPAGERQDRTGDAWAILVVGVEPYRDDLGASDVYLLDAVIEPMPLVRALDVIVNMYCRHGRILKLGVEKVGLSTTEVHIMNALRGRGRMVSVENGNIEILRPAGRSKAERIEGALAWPLKNGKIHVSTAVDAAYRERLKTEAQRLPVWHDDGLDALSYCWDLIKKYRFPLRSEDMEPDDGWDKEFKTRKSQGLRRDSWLRV